MRHKLSLTAAAAILAILFVCSIGHAGIQYVYDELNRLAEVHYADGTTILYSYDEIGNRQMQVVTHAPYMPSNPALPNGSTDVQPSVDLSWAGGDPDGDTVTYKVLLDTSSLPSTLVSDGSSLAAYHAQNLNCETTYYWSVSSIDSHGVVTRGPVWHFTTGTCSVVKNMRNGLSYSTLTASYRDAQDGDEIRCRGIRISDSLTLDRNISLTIDGGYDSAFSFNPDKTTLVGAPVISSGTITWKNFIISN